MACNYLEFDISSIDLADATGNSNVPPYVDGIVYGEYNDCSGNTVTQQYSSAGIFSATTCFDSLFLVSLYYYKNDAAYVGVSTFINTGEPCTTPSPTPDPTPNSTPDPTPNSTPASTPGSTPASTPGSTPASTPGSTPASTPSVTSTPTQTQTTTPSASGIICGLGITTGTYYYTDCCGDLIQGNVQNLTVSMDYTKPSSGVNKLNSFATQACLTPTPTNTQSYTQTNKHTFD